MMVDDDDDDDECVEADENAQETRDKILTKTKKQSKRLECPRAATEAGCAASSISR